MLELLPGDPERVGPYRIIGRLGAGGMGRVFAGRSAGGRLVAVKVIRDELAADPDFRARFGREIALARSVSGLFTAPVVDADVDAPVPWLATAYVAGPSLADAVRDHGPLPAASVRALAAGLAESLRAIHAADVVHRDLKPTNVLLAEDGPRVIDFGISRAAEASALTHTGLIVGSPGFMSPEQAEGRDVGAPSDVFSLGAVLVFAATGHGPFGTGSTAALVYRVVHSPPSLQDVPAQLQPMIGRCLAKEAGQRPTAGELLGELADANLQPGWLPASVTGQFARYTPPGPGGTQAAVLDARPAVPEGPPTVTAARRRSEPAVTQPPRPGAPPRRRGRRRLALSGLIAALMAASAAAAFALAHPARQTAATQLPTPDQPAPVTTPATPASPPPSTTTPQPPTASPSARPGTGSPGTGSSPATRYAQAVIAGQPTAYWQFSGAPGTAGYADSSGQGNTLPAGPTSLTSPGPAAGTAAISTANGGTLPTAPLSPLTGDAPRTVEAWFRTTANGCIFSAGQGTHTRALSLSLRDGPVNAPTPGAPGFYYETNDADNFIPIGNLTDGTWHYLAVTLTGKMADIVIDGTQPPGYIWNGDPSMTGGGAYGGLTAQPFTLPYTPDTAATSLGMATAGSGGIGSGLVGTIAEVAVYPRALPVSALVSHYQLLTS